jgi:thiosulfate/3-mercaptopyruvate sulfurtransferase
LLVSTAWFADHLDDPRIVIVDLRWREDGSGRDRFARSHIPGARFLDWTTDIADPGNRLAFMLPGPDDFAAVMERCGIGDESVVVAYADEHGSGPYRLWWACRVYGHDGVRVLDGGLDKWLAEGRPMTSDVSAPRPSSWTPRPQSGLVASSSDVTAARSNPNVVVLDSRSPEQFRGEAVWFETGPITADPNGVAHTPRGDLRAGRIPWARNVPAADLYRPDFTMKSEAELRELFWPAGAPASRAIAYCGVGLSACALLFALERAGVRETALYDASWDEWGRDPALPVARG